MNAGREKEEGNRKKGSKTALTQLPHFPGSEPRDISKDPWFSKEYNFKTLKQIDILKFAEKSSILFPPIHPQITHTYLPSFTDHTLN